MAKAVLRRIGAVEVVVPDPAKAAAWYAASLGLSLVPGVAEPELEPPQGGTRIALTSPAPRAVVGGPTGIAFTTGDLLATLAGFQRKGVAVAWADLDPAAEGGVHATFEDPDGNVHMVFQSEAEARGEGGLERIAFVNVVSRDLARAQRFWGKLGLVPGDALPDAGWQEFRSHEQGAALGVFQPLPARYGAPEAYDADLEHVGEETGVRFLVEEFQALAAAVRPTGGRFDAEDRRLQDPDGNGFLVEEARGQRGPA